MEKITSEDFFPKVVGKSSWNVIWKPMMEAKFGEKAKDIPAIWLWERIVQRFNSRGKAGQKEYLGYMEGSFQTFITALLAAVTNNGAKVMAGANVESYVIENNQCKGIRVDGKVCDFDLVINTTALPLHMRMLGEEHKVENWQKLSKIKYDGVVCLILVLDKPLTDYYWINMSDSDICFGGLIEHTNFIDESNYNGKHIVYMSRYLDQKDKMLKMEDEEVLDIFVKDLKKILPEFKQDRILEYQVTKAAFAQPLWPLKYSEIKPKYKTDIENLYIANTSQIYPNDRGMNFSIMLGKNVVDEIEKKK